MTIWTGLSYGIPFLIAGISLLDVMRFSPDPSTNRTWPKVIVILLGAALLVVQAIGDKQKENTANAAAKEVAAKADEKLRQALSSQRDQLTAAFTTGTDQVIKSATGEAEQTRKDATSETDAIKHQATEQLTQVQGFMLGTTTCPHVVGSVTRPSGRPDSLAIFNLDKKLNMHDLSMELIEYGPGEPGTPWSAILQRKVINIPLIIPESVRTVPFKFLSRMTDIDVQITLNTRTTRCNGRLGLYDTGKNVWVNDSEEMFAKDGTLAYRGGEKLSPGIEKSHLDPDSQP